MKLIADFHIHSHFSMATSKKLVPEHLDYWARMKGITIVGSGDFTHPGWVAELEEKLEPAEPGLFKLKRDVKNDPALQTPFLPGQDVRFLLTAEISNIYKKNDKVRKVHNVVFAPDFKTVHAIQQKIQNLGGNITSDGRPILGLDSKDLLELCLDCSGDIFFIPAHIWTPWFSVLGDKSGFDSVEECFDDLTKYIFAVETGLSSDPPMNWMCSFLDRFTLVSNSDAHSPEKLGRNANVFDIELSYQGIVDALKTGDPKRCLGTIDLFPQEGKYHYDGHRKCGVCWDPVQTLSHNRLCTGCGKPVTVGVMNRVVRISDRENPENRPNRLPFASIIPLKEILSEILGVAPTSKKVDKEYFSIIKKGIPELELLLDTAIDEIESMDQPLVAEAIRRMRNREVFVQEGYDGEYGVIKVFQKDENKHLDKKQKTLFIPVSNSAKKKLQQRQMIAFDLAEYRRLQKLQNEPTVSTESLTPPPNVVVPKDYGLNPEQQQAVSHFQGPALVIAGPGTGKTRVLAYRILYLIKEKGIEPERILAVTFTNRAAAEMQERLQSLLKVELNEQGMSSRLQVTTFHSLGLSILKEYLAEGQQLMTECQEFTGRDVHFSLIDEDDRKLLLGRLPGMKKNSINRFSASITSMKQQLSTPPSIEDQETRDIVMEYERLLKEQNLFDLDDLLYIPVRLFENFPAFLDAFRERKRWLLVDEYQDINFAQYRLIRLIAPGTGSGIGKDDETANLCVIGDPDQAIYGFRGADVAFIRKFQEDYPGAALYRLQQSYRCSDAILQASRDVIRKQKDAEGDLSGLDKGVTIKISANHSHRAEAEFIARTIEDMIGGLRFFSMDSSITAGHRVREIDSLDDFAVLCRVKGQFEALEKAFMDHAIPYRAIGHVPFFKEEPVNHVIDVLECIENPRHSFYKQKLIAGRVIDPLQLPGLLEQAATGTFKQQPVAGLINNLLDTYFPGLKAAQERVFKQLLEVAGNFGSNLGHFLKFAVLGTAADTYRPDVESVTLMTLHAAKGLEFQCVFIPGCEDGLLPYSLYENHTGDRDEEKRLLYVGMTRAKRYLFLCHAAKRFIQGREYCLPRSPFLDPIEKELLENAQLKERKKKEKESEQLSLF